MGPFHLKIEDGVDFRYFRKCRAFENILFELGVVDYSWVPIFVLIRFWEIRKFQTNGLRESPCIKFRQFYLISSRDFSRIRRDPVLFRPINSIVIVSTILGSSAGLKSMLHLLVESGRYRQVSPTEVEH
jgi:hypothetical protein